VGAGPVQDPGDVPGVKPGLRHIAGGLLDRGSRALDTGHDDPGIGERAGEQPDAAVQVQGALAWPGRQSFQHCGNEGVGGLRVHLPKAVSAHVPPAARGGFLDDARITRSDPHRPGCRHGSDHLGALGGVGRNTRQGPDGDQAAVVRQRDNVV
jgi:hypothetical protein